MIGPQSLSSRTRESLYFEQDSNTRGEEDNRGVKGLFLAPDGTLVPWIQALFSSFC